MNCPWRCPSTNAPFSTRARPWAAPTASRPLVLTKSRQTRIPPDLSLHLPCRIGIRRSRLPLQRHLLRRRILREQRRVLPATVLVGISIGPRISRCRTRLVTVLVTTPMARQLQPRATTNRNSMEVLLPPRKTSGGINSTLSGCLNVPIIYILPRYGQRQYCCLVYIIACVCCLVPSSGQFVRLTIFLLVRSL